MYDLKVFKWDNDIKYQTVNDKCQTIRMIFYRWYYPYKNRFDWYISFDIVNKRKENFKYKEQTGKDGLKSLLWAKKCIQDFIENEIDKTKENVILIQWTDIKRGKAYIRGLESMGFKLITFDRRPTLMLKINKNVGLD